MEFKVTSDQADRRIDRVLRGLYPAIPLAAIMKAIRKGAVRVNGGKTSGNVRLVEGDCLSVPWSAEEQTNKTAESVGREAFNELEAVDLPILFRSDDLLCVNKPAGLLSQPDRRGGDSVVTRIWRMLSWAREDFRPALIHRLDRNVSGVVVVALNAPTLRLLSGLMRDEQLEKRYRAVVTGEPPASGEIVLPLRKDEERNRVFVDPQGRPALTRYTTLQSQGGYALLELQLVTGRPHQARVHLSAIGHPIVGDGKYGGKEIGKRKSRLFLHAYSISFPDLQILPKYLQGSVIKAVTPPEFANFFTKAR